MENVDPIIAVEYSETEFKTIPNWLRQSLIRNFRQIWETSTNPGSEEDVVI